jgi:hypothetical protein
VLILCHFRQIIKGSKNQGVYFGQLKKSGWWYRMAVITPARKTTSLRRSIDIERRSIDNDD